MPDRRTYLAAMGIDVWRMRATAQASADAVVDSVARPPVDSPERTRTRAMPAPTSSRREPAPTLARSVSTLADTTVASARGDIAHMDWDALARTVAACRACPLHTGRTQTVFGVGDRAADWLFIGEAPGAEEDRQGEPFVGRAGQLLNSMLFALGMSRERVYIANILKCRPPNNRDPMPEESHCCRPFLDRQIELIAPKIIVALGRIAAQQLLHTDTPIGRMRGRLYHHGAGERRIPVIVTYHPAYLLRSPHDKPKAWADLQLARQAATSGAT